MLKGKLVLSNLARGIILPCLKVVCCRSHVLEVGIQLLKDLLLDVEGSDIALVLLEHLAATVCEVPVVDPVLVEYHRLRNLKSIGA